MAGLNLEDDTPLEFIPEEPPKPPAAIEKLIEEAKKALTAQEKGEKRSLSMVVIGAFIWARSWYILLMNSGPGHVDAGKSTMMGRLLYELGRIDEKRRVANERAGRQAGRRAGAQRGGGASLSARAAHSLSARSRARALT